MSTLPPPTPFAYVLARGNRSMVKLEQRIQRDGRALWSIYEDSSSCLLEPGVWGWEPQPSSISDDFRERTRRSWETGIETWRRHLVAALAGGTFQGWVGHGIDPRNCDELYDPWGLAALLADKGPRPDKARWIGVETAPLLPRWEGQRDEAEARFSADIDVRRGLGLLADDLRRAGLGGAPVCGPDGFAPEASAAIVAAFGRADDAYLAPLSRDLGRHVAEAGGFDVGLAVLVPAGSGGVDARIKDPLRA